MRIIRLVCFDMWGTLCHGGGRQQITAVQTALGADKIPYPKFLHQLEISLMTHPWPLKKGFTDLLAKLNLPLKGRAVGQAEAVWKTYVRSVPPYPETDAVLHQLKQTGLKLALVSNTDLTSIKIKLPQLGWDKYFDKLFVSANIGVLKPDKKIFQAVEDYFRLEKNQVLYVDDSRFHGVEPAQKFGWQALWLNRQAKKSEKNYINNLTKIFKRL